MNGIQKVVGSIPIVSTIKKGHLLLQMSFLFYSAASILFKNPRDATAIRQISIPLGMSTQ